MENKGKNLVRVLAIVLILLVVGVSYAAFNYDFTGDTNLIETETIELELLESDSEIISIENTLPMYDEDGKKLEETFDFAITTKTKASKNMFYAIILEKLVVDTGYTAFEDDEVKVYLEDYEGNTLVSPTRINDLTNYAIYYDTNKHNKETPKITDKYKLRVWIDQSVDVSDWTQNTKLQYKFKIGVSATNDLLLSFTKKDIVVGETIYDYDRTRDGLFYDSSTGTWNEIVLDVIADESESMIKIANEPWEYNPLFRTSFGFSDDYGNNPFVSSDIVPAMRMADAGYFVVPLMFGEEMIGGFASVETSSEEMPLSPGVWLSIGTSLNYLEDFVSIKVEKVNGGDEMIQLEDTSLYRISDTYFDKNEFIGSSGVITYNDGSTSSFELSENSIVVDQEMEGTFAVMTDDMVFLVTDGSLGISEGIWIQGDLYPDIERIIIMK